MRYLCFDIGDRRTGIALGDDETRIASPVGVIECRFSASDMDALLQRLADTVTEYGPDEIVVGLPLNMDNTHGPQARKIAIFAERVSRQVDLPVRLHDERLTSFDADQKMARTNLTHKQKKERRDALAATTILSDFLNRNINESDFGGRES